MARNPRQFSASGFYHVVCRGNGKQLIFEDDEDRSRFLGIYASALSEADMGRTKYSNEERRTIVATFIQAAQNIIDTDGLESVSIRRVSSEAGYSSATLYLYFSDASELTLMESPMP